MAASRFPLTATVLAGCAFWLATGCAAPRGPSSTAITMQTPGGEADRPPVSQISDRIDGNAAQIRKVSHQEPMPSAEVLPAAANAFFGPSTSLEQLIEFALSNNPQLQAAHWQAHAMQEQIPQACSLEDPMLMASPALLPTETADGPMDFMLTVSQKLPWFGKRALRGAVASNSAQVAWSEWADTELQVMERVKRAYYEIYFVDRAIEVNRDLRDKLTQVIRVAETRYETDAARTGLESVLRARNEVAKLELMLAELQRSRGEALAEMAQAIHLPRAVSMELQPTLAETPFVTSRDDLIALIEPCQPMLAARRSEIRRDRAAEALAQREYLPDVTTGFQWQAMGAPGLSPIATGTDSYYLTFGVNLPIYRGRLDSAVREARFKAANAAERYDSAWDELRASVQKLHAQIVEHDRAIQILRGELMPQSETAFTLSVEAFRVGRIGFEQMIESYRELLQYRIDLHARESRREQTIATLERTVGCALADVSQQPILER